MKLEGRKDSKPAKIGQFFTLKILKLLFLKNFPRFDLTAFFWEYKLFPLTEPLRHARPGRQPPQAPCS